MTAAQHFAEQLRAAEACGRTGPELLPDRLASASAAVLGCDGAGLSLHFAPGRRLPLGASDGSAATAERLQFTVGEGPCLGVHATGRPVIAREDDLRRRWPALHDVLVAHTPFRSVIGLPLDGGLTGVGALDLFFTSPEDLSAVGLDDALTVMNEISSRFQAAAAADRGRAEGPAWLDAPAAGRRAQVWQALGYLNSGLGVTSSEALSLLRAHAYASDRVLDDVVEDVLAGRLPLDRLGTEPGPAAEGS